MLTEIASLLASPVFWFGTFFMGILINLISDYLKPVVDKLLNKHSEGRRARSAEKERTIEAKVAAALATPDGVVLAYLDWFMWVLYGFSFLGAASLCVWVFNKTTPQTYERLPFSFLIPFFFVFSFLSFNISTTSNEILRRARVRKVSAVIEDLKCRAQK